MTMVAIDKSVKDLVEEFADLDESMNSAVNRLLDEYDSVSLLSDEYDKRNIRLSDDTFERLKDRKLWAGESNASVIARLLFAEQVKRELKNEE